MTMLSKSSRLLLLLFAAQRTFDTQNFLMDSFHSIIQFVPEISCNFHCLSNYSYVFFCILLSDLFLFDFCQWNFFQKFQAKKCSCTCARAQTWIKKWSGRTNTFCFFTPPHPTRLKIVKRNFYLIRTNFLTF